MKNIKLNRLLAIGVISLWSCNDKAPGVTPEEGDTNIISVTTSQFTSSNMALDTLTVHNFHRSVIANGMIDVPPENKASVSAYFSGYIKEIKLLPGQLVKKGQVLFTLENPEYVQIQREYLESKGQLKYLKADYERQKALASDKVTSQKSFLKAEADYEVILATHQSLRKKLVMMNISPDRVSGNNILSSITVTSPISGFVTSVNAIKGMFLTPSDIAVTITNTDHLHLELNIFEKDLLAIREGQAIKFRIQNTDEEFDATVYLIGKSVDPEKRTVAIHGHLRDESRIHAFAPGMYIEGEIQTSVHSAPSLPAEAVVNVENNYYVLVKRGVQDEALMLEKREVMVGTSDNAYTEILNASDFRKGTEFLTKGAFNLVLE
ncbi:Putative Co/Zn/Cd efflux system membrane fusion protein [Fulvivirga imtechensis AK7]|uniref:Putative Co/Zn/Cd efflux system membrane fusion protein n=1 Tax=Fulvivirga imtechensis AK7 TaxID=1237149 RepID=L8JV43_9BACT|nr:efflux RND transporter periplasmic adaptor subunit [Fulvivirga imtechensis]ELR71132.1 Putative Co/Zn/Cd efflux system membrane fusion protein [Fulvivirga imtechensis AK7]